MKRRIYYIYTLIFLSFLSTQVLSGQNIGVTSFRLLENDLTANTYGTTERDQNGEVAALIKIVTTEQGFTFDGGMVGIVKTKQALPEIWVYVPHGIKKITILHPKLGVLRDYWFPIPIEKARTYEMILSTGKVETIVTRTANKQYVMFNVTPANAIVELDGIPLDVNNEGYAEKSVPYGTYSYRVSCANYHTEAGQVIVSAQEKAKVDVSLRPNHGWVDIKGDSKYHGAHIYINNERIGQVPLKSEALKSGTYQIKIIKPLYKPYEQQVTITDGNTTPLTVALTPNFANITFVTNNESEIWIDDKLYGKGKCAIGLEIGEYTVEVKRQSHRATSEVITIYNTSERTILLSSPTPIYGIVDITSTPSLSTVYMDGVEIGETPLILNEALIGSHEFKFVKDGYAEQTKSINIEENGTHRLNVALVEKPKEVEVKITSKPSRATAWIDGKNVGLTPLYLPIKIGLHDFSVSKDGYWSSKQYNKEIYPTTNNVHFNLNKIPKTKKERPENNKHYIHNSLYIEANGEAFQYSYGGGFILGKYHKSFNIEGALQKSTYSQCAIRAGIGIKEGRNLLITPQFGMNLFWGIPIFYCNLPEIAGGIPIRREEDETDLGCSVSCRLQYCISKKIAVSITPEYTFYSMSEEGWKDEYISIEKPTKGFYLRVGLVLNWGDYRDK